MHYRNECEHGTVVSQCRCADPSKTVHIVACPWDCPERDKGIEPSPRLDLATTRELLEEIKSRLVKDVPEGESLDFHTANCNSVLLALLQMLTPDELKYRSVDS